MRVAGDQPSSRPALLDVGSREQPRKAKSLSLLHIPRAYPFCFFPPAYSLVFDRSTIFVGNIGNIGNIGYDGLARLRDGITLEADPLPR